MTKIEFESILNVRLNKIRETLESKEKEYSADQDRFHNFNVAAGILKCSKERALLGMLIKHIVSVLDMVDKSDEGLSFDHGYIEEKIGDVINYMILLEAMFKEGK